MPISFEQRCRMLRQLAKTEAAARGMLPRPGSRREARSTTGQAANLPVASTAPIGLCDRHGLRIDQGREHAGTNCVMSDRLCPRCRFRYLPVRGACICAASFEQQLSGE